MDAEEQVSQGVKKMLITVPPPYEPEMICSQTPPPTTLPKPGKDNLRLQRLLKKAAKQAPPATQPVKSFQVSLSPVSEASPDLERSERSSPLKTLATSPHITIQLPPRFCIRPIPHHVASPFPKAKPFTLKVTEQRRLSEHLKLTVSPAASPVLQQGARESPWQPRGVTPDTHSQLRSPQPRCVFVFPDSAVSPSPVAEAPVGVTQVTKMQARVHSVQAPRAKTPLSDQSSAVLHSETLAAHTGKPSEQAPVALHADKAGATISNSKVPVLLPLTAELPYTTTRPASPREPNGVSQLPVTHPTIHSICIPRAKTPLSGQAPTALSNGDRVSSATRLEVSYLEQPLGQTPVTHTANQPVAATPKSQAPTLSTTTAELPQATLPSSVPTEPVGVAFPVPQAPDPQFSSPEAPGNDTARSRTEQIPEPPSKSRRPLTPHVAQKQEATVPTDDTRASSTEAKEESVIPRQLTATIPRASPFPKAEPPPSVEKVRPLKATLSGWSRLRKHLIVEPEDPQFPETEPAKPEPVEAGNKAEGSQDKTSQDSKVIKSRAIRMWDAVLYQMTTLKRRKQQEQGKGIRKQEGVSCWHRLPLLHRPRFDARKLKELASKPMTKITTMLESSLLQCKTEDPKNFNRTAPGWLLK